MYVKEIYLQAVTRLTSVTLVSAYTQGFFNSLRSELTDHPKILISTVCPGPVQSQIVKNAFTEELNKVMHFLLCDLCDIMFPVTSFPSIP